MPHQAVPLNSSQALRRGDRSRPRPAIAAAPALVKGRTRFDLQQIGGHMRHPFRAKRCGTPGTPPSALDAEHQISEIFRSQLARRRATASTACATVWRRPRRSNSRSSADIPMDAVAPAARNPCKSPLIHAGVDFRGDLRPISPKQAHRLPDEERRPFAAQPRASLRQSTGYPPGVWFRIVF